MHAAMPILFVTVIEGIRHLIRLITDSRPAPGSSGSRSPGGCSHHWQSPGSVETSSSQVRVKSAGADYSSALIRALDEIFGEGTAGGIHEAMLHSAAHFGG
jgi:hypothetical protein